MRACPDLIGRRFGRLVVIARAPSGRDGRSRWVCRCDCGGEKVVRHDSLTSGKTQSCGCFYHEAMRANGRANVRHGATRTPERTPEYRSWRAMVNRCVRQADKSFDRYGGRGITVCARWRESFEAFLADMGPRPPGTTIDRFPDNDGNYEPGNCRRATYHEQNLNKRNSRRNTTEAA